MANQDDSFIREVNEELRSDRMKDAWRRYGKILIAAAVILVVGTAGWRGAAGASQRGGGPRWLPCRSASAGARDQPALIVRPAAGGPLSP